MNNICKVPQAVPRLGLGYFGTQAIDQTLFSQGFGEMEQELEQVLEHCNDYSDES